MPIVNRITNKDKPVEEKVNYFLDRITHATTYAGWHEHLELESPTALLEKILFRLRADTKYRLKYFDNYFKNAFFTSDPYWNRYPPYVYVHEVVSRYNQASTQKSEEKTRLLSDVRFQDDLDALHKELTDKMVKDLMDAVITNVRCPHKLNELVPNSTDTHAAFFESAALLLVAEYIFRGYSRSEIREIISNVFSKDIDIFPFPAGIRTKSQKKKHLAEGTLQNQLHGFTNAFHQEHGTGIILIKVYGGKFPEEFEFRYNKVTFFGQNHPLIKQIKEKMSPSDNSDFFTEGDYLLAAAEIKWHSPYSLMESILKTVRSELPFLAAVLERDFSVDTTSNYIRLTSKKKYVGTAWSSRKFDGSIAESALQQLADNAYEALRKKSGMAVDWFLKHESLFVMAHKNRSIADYWLYLETLLSYNRTEKEVMGMVSSIILGNEKLMHDRRLLTTIRGIFGPFSRGFYLLNVPQERWSKIMIAIPKGKIAREIRKVEYPFVKELIKEYDAVLDAAYYKKAKAYYERLLTESYEYRNFFVHGGLESKVSKDKLVATLPNIVVRLRWMIFEALKKGDHDTPFDLMLEKLVEEGKLLLTTAPKS